ELIKVGVLDEDAVTRIKRAIFNDIALSRPSSQAKDEFEATLHRRLDDLFTAKEASASHVEDDHEQDAPS
ncbi:MAG: hypothetical protein ACRYG4_25640, partial [Janthinobacterium lividum]